MPECARAGNRLDPDTQVGILVAGGRLVAAMSSGEVEWSGADSNRQLPACKAGTLPIELPPREGSIVETPRLAVLGPGHARPAAGTPEKSRVEVMLARSRGSGETGSFR